MAQYESSYMIYEYIQWSNILIFYTTSGKYIQDSNQPQTSKYTAISHPPVSGVSLGSSLTHWGQDKMAAIFKWVFCTDDVQIAIKIHWSLFQGSN